MCLHELTNSLNRILALARKLCADKQELHDVLERERHTHTHKHARMRTHTQSEREDVSGVSKCYAKGSDS